MAAFVQHMRMHHGSADVLVTEQFLDSPDVVTGFKEVRGERMPEWEKNNGVWNRPRSANRAAP